MLNEGLVVNDYSLSRAESSTSLYSLNGGTNRSRSVSPVNNRSYSSTGARARSRSTSRRSLRSAQSVDFERQGRSLTPQRRSNSRSTTRLYNDDNDDDYHNRDDGKLSFRFIHFFYLKTI